MTHQPDVWETRIEKAVEDLYGPHGRKTGLVIDATLLLAGTLAVVAAFTAVAWSVWTLLESLA